MSERFKLQTKLIVGNRSNPKIPKGYKGLNCDRQSVMGNPFKLTNESERANVIAAYRDYIRAVIYNNYDPLGIALFISKQRGVCVSDHWSQPTRADIFNWFSELKLQLERRKVILYCHCSPRQCHVEEIINLVGELWQSWITA